MGLETFSYITSLNSSNPVGATDPKSQGDDHLRGLKLTLLNSFPAISGAVTATHAQLNYLAGSHTLPDSVLSTNVPLLNAPNVFVQASTNEQTLNTTAAAGSRWKFQTNSVTRGYVGAPGAANDLVVGSALGDMVLNALSGAWLVSVDGGSSIAHKFTASNATTALNGVAVSDFARLSQANTFTAGTQTITAANARLLVNDTSANVSIVGFEKSGSLNAFFGISNKVSGLIVGDADKDIGFVGTGGAFAFSGDSGATAHFKLNAAGLLTTPNASAAEVGYKGLPQNSQSVSYTTVLADANKNLHQTGATKTFTIDANATVPFPIGTTLVFTCDNATGVSIAITTDTLRLAGTATTGTRSLAQYGVATAIKILPTTWLISGPGLS